MATRIAIVTGTRAEYGLLQPLAGLIRKHRPFDLQLIVTGTHLSAEFGSTYRQILKDGFTIAAKVPIEMKGDGPLAVSVSASRALEGLARAFARLKPDWVILLGDRYETLTAAMAAHLAGIPVAHISGGELTAGATDDAFRHAITKMSFLHFTATEAYRRRVIQLGEDPSRVFHVGALGIDNIRRLPVLSREDLEKELDISLEPSFLLVTFHPVTLDKQPAGEQFSILLECLEKMFPVKSIITFPNADAGGKSIIALIRDFASRHPQQVRATPSLGQLKYLSLMKFASAVVGNSSSGIVEAPSLQTPTVDIGNRQKGRIAADSILHTPLQGRKILQSIRQALSPDFATFIRGVKNPYDKGDTASRILKVLVRYASRKDIQKTFFDINRKLPCTKSAGRSSRR
jgi:UDP-hydrolysing UDP-N-acetyl-D-glucosamine 2-epimerase